MKKLLIAMLCILPLIGCSASIGQPPTTTSTTYSTPAAPAATATTPVSSTTVTKTTY